MSDSIRILITDDHAIVREGIRLILETVEGIEVVGEAGDGQSALDLAAQTAPDVILMDLRMPGMDGLTAIQHLRDNQPEIAVVILTTFNEDDLMLKGLEAGAHGYLLKDVDRGTLIRTIESAARGDTLLQPEILARALAKATATRASAHTSDGSAGGLTEREMEVLLAAAEGKRAKEIAYAMGISERTIKAHLTNIYNKLGVDTRAAAIATAAHLGLLPGEGV
jgi:NarL family two-component system response regulator YdfI